MLIRPSKNLVELRGIEPLTLRLPEVERRIEVRLVALSRPDSSGHGRSIAVPDTADGTQTALPEGIGHTPTRGSRSGLLARMHRKTKGASPRRPPVGAPCPTPRHANAFPDHAGDGLL